MNDNKVQHAKSQAYYLNWLWVLMIIGVFVSHWLLPFTGDNWLITGKTILPSARIIATINSQLIMPLLFFIAGARAWLALTTRSNGQYIRSRLMTLLPPILMSLLFTPLQIYFASLHHGLYQGTLLNFLPELFSADQQIGFDFLWHSAFVYPIWFLIFLLASELIGLPVIAWLKSEPGQKLGGRLAEALRFRGSLILMALPIIVLQFIFNAPFADRPYGSEFVFWFSFFVYGNVFFSSEQVMTPLRHAGRRMLIVALLALFAVLLLGVFTVFHFDTVFSLFDVNLTRTTPWLYYLLLALLGLSSWSLVVAFVALGMRHLNVHNRLLDLFHEAWLPFYVLHYAVIVILGYYVVQLRTGVWAQVIILGFGALAITWCFYGLFIKPLPLLRRAFGLPRLEEQGSSVHTGAQPGSRMLLYRTLYLSALIAFGLLIGANLPPVFQTAGQRLDIPEGWSIITPGGETTCALGDPFKYFVRSAGNTQQVMIYFQTGGACWNGASCGEGSLAYDYTVSNNEFASYGGIFDFDNPENPIRDYDVVFVPYCTADLHAGDAVVDYSDFAGNTITIRHKGYTNVSTVLNWMYQQYPSPERVLVVGTSAGSLASIIYAGTIMEHYQDSEVLQFGDGHVGIAPADWEAPFTWNITAHLPGFLRPEDIADFRVNSLYKATAHQFPLQRFAEFSSDNDSFQIAYLALTGGDASGWTDQMYAALDELAAELDNFYYYVAPGLYHTILAFDYFYTTEVDGIRLRDWFADYIAFNDAQEKVKS